MLLSFFTVPIRRASTPTPLHFTCEYRNITFETSQTRCIAATVSFDYQPIADNPRHPRPSPSSADDVMRWHNVVFSTPPAAKFAQRRRMKSVGDHNGTHHRLELMRHGRRCRCVGVTNVEVLSIGLIVERIFTYSSHRDSFY